MRRSSAASASGFGRVTKTMDAKLAVGLSRYILHILGKESEIGWNKIIEYYDATGFGSTRRSIEHCHRVIKNSLHTTLISSDIRLKGRNTYEIAALYLHPSQSELDIGTDQLSASVLLIGPHLPKNIQVLQSFSLSRHAVTRIISRSNLSSLNEVKAALRPALLMALPAWLSSRTTVNRLSETTLAPMALPCGNGLLLGFSMPSGYKSQTNFRTFLDGSFLNEEQISALSFLQSIWKKHYLSLECVVLTLDPDGIGKKVFDSFCEFDEDYSQLYHGRSLMLRQTLPHLKKMTERYNLSVQKMNFESSGPALTSVGNGPSDHSQEIEKYITMNSAGSRK